MVEALLLQFAVTLKKVKKWLGKRSRVLDIDVHGLPRAGSNHEIRRCETDKSQGPNTHALPSRVPPAAVRPTTLAGWTARWWNRRR